MAVMDIVIKNCKIVENGRAADTNIYIKNGEIAKITHEKIEADETIDASNNYVLPGIIDSHVHFREPGLSHKEDWLSGSRAAVSSGVTTVLDMPNTVPPTTTVGLLNEKRKLAKKSLVNYGFHFGAAADNINEIKKARNIASVKVFMNLSTGNMMIDSEEKMKEVFLSSKLVTTHAEKDKVVYAVNLQRECKNRLYLCHISLKSEIDFIRENKNKNIFVEVTPHHLFLTKEDFEKKKSFAYMKPELKTKKDQEALWLAIKEGLVDTIATDHAPHTIEEKSQESYPAGVPGIETMLPLLLNEVNKRNLSLQKVIELICHNPARIFKIRSKGFIKEGYDADLVVVDMKKERTVKEEELYTKCKWSPFDGMKLKGWPVVTIVKGKLAFDGEFYNAKSMEVVFDE